MEDHEHLLARHQIEKNERLAAKLQQLLEVCGFMQHPPYQHSPPAPTSNFLWAPPPICIEGVLPQLADMQRGADISILETKQRHPAWQLEKSKGREGDGNSHPRIRADAGLSWREPGILYLHGSVRCTKRRRAPAAPLQHPI